MTFVFWLGAGIGLVVGAALAMAALVIWVARADITQIYPS